MNDEGAFPQLIELIRRAQSQDAGLHRILLQLLYEMSRIQRIRVQELSTPLPDPSRGGPLR